jgi:hypothetical protein
VDAATWAASAARSSAERTLLWRRVASLRRDQLEHRSAAECNKLADHADDIVVAAFAAITAYRAFRGHDPDAMTLVGLLVGIPPDVLTTWLADTTDHP